MMPVNLPIAFRVVQLTADESGMHRVTLVEVRRPMLAQATASRGPEAPPTTLLLDVTPEQFSMLRIGQSFSLIPDAEEKGVTQGLQDLMRPGSGYGLGQTLR